MGQKTIREISVAWKEYKQPYVKQSTMAAYVLILENHILPNFGESEIPVSYTHLTLPTTPYV